MAVIKSYCGDRVNPGDVLGCSLYGDLRIAEEEPEEDLSSNHNLFLSPSFLMVVPLISFYLRRNPGRRIDRINSDGHRCAAIQTFKITIYIFFHFIDFFALRKSPR